MYQIIIMIEYRSIIIKKKEQICDLKINYAKIKTK